MRNMRWSLAGLFVCGLPVACADPCIDDGLLQEGQGSCPQASASQTDGQTDSNGDTDTVTATMGSATMGSNTDGMTGSQMGNTATIGETLDGTNTDTLGETETASDTDTMGETDTAGGTLWCVDADEDGFGDPDMCQQSDEPVPGSVDNGDDCDDTNESTFPGAAPNDDPRACMQDVDGDDWGDDGMGGGDPLPPGVVPGTDCLDDDVDVFPGAAENETPPDLCAEDQDGDGWGNDDPPPGADPGNDCADDDANIFPGAAPNETPPDLCAQDADGDDWGDDTPPGGVDPGTDCDDTNADAFPGAAPNETPPDLCTIDADGDGYGDANPGGGGGGGSGPLGGSDCYDTNPDLSPATLQLSAFMPFNAGAFTQRSLQTVDPGTGALAPFIDLEDAMGNNPDINLVTATLGADGTVIANDLDGAELYTVDYAATCGMGTGVVTGLGQYGTPGVAVVCGLEYAGDGSLYGIDNNDTLITFDPVTGQDTGAIPIMLGGGPLNISSCGMAYDCAQDRLLVANGIDWSIYSVDPATGDATLLRDLDPFFGAGTWSPVGLAWDSVSRTVYLSTGTNLYNVDIDDAAAAPVLISPFPQQVSNLGYMPICI